MTVEFRALKESEKEECIDLWCTVWPGDNRDYFKRYFYGDVEWLPYYTQVAVEENKLVSAVHICKRTVPCGELRMTMGGIANVATLPEYRGKGYNTGCLKRAIAVMEGDAMDFSLLFTGIHDYYGHLGYSKLARKMIYGVIPEGFSPLPNSITVRPAEADDLAKFREIYTDYNKNRAIAVVRSDAYWRDWLQVTPDKIPDHLFTAVNNQNEIAGYARCGTFQSAVPYGPEEIGVRLTEFGIALHVGNEDEVTQALINFVSARFISEGTKHIRLDIALEPSVLKALERVVHKVETKEVTAGMFRLLHRENLSRGISMQLNDRWISAGRPRGSISFNTPYGAISIEADGAFLLISPTNDSDSLPQETFFGLLFGLLSASEAAENSNLHPLIEGLFPKMASVYYGADGF